jgi:predicted CoA-binding protein
MANTKMKKTVIIGATNNPSRYAYLAAGMLSEYKHEFIPLGIKKGEVYGKPIVDIYQRPEISDVDTVTLYIGPRHHILGLKPKRVIFNPGTENPEFEKMIEDSGAEAWEACTLVLLRSGQY